MNYPENYGICRLIDKASSVTVAKENEFFSGYMYYRRVI